MTRSEAYHWLSHVMGVPEEQTHMTVMMSKGQLNKVIAICDGLMGRTEVDDDFVSPPPEIPR